MGLRIIFIRLYDPQILETTHTAVLNETEGFFIIKFKTFLHLIYYVRNVYVLYIHKI